MSTTKKNRSGPLPKGTISNQNTVSGQIFSGGIAIQGSDAHVTIHQNTGVAPNALSVLFEKLYQQIETRPIDPNVDKEEIAETIKKIEDETAKGEKLANPAKLERWMEDLGKMAPDILDIALASLAGPVSGITEVLRKIAVRVQQQITQK